MVVVWGKFILLLVLIYIFGSRASRSADAIAEKRGLARAFMGVVFISAVTSFPELFTGISAVTTVHSPNIAFGEILGSCIFNLLIIAIAELIFRKRKLYQLSGKLNFLPLGFSLILIAILTFAISLKLKLSIFKVSIMSVLILIFYFVFLRIIFQERRADVQEEVEYKKRGIKKETLSFVVSALIIIAVGWYLPVVGKELAQIMHWNDSFVGVIFLALVTSFPELVVSIAAVKIGAVEMFIGNIAGSNLFNIAIIFFVDLFHRPGEVFGYVSDKHISVGVIAVLMSFIIFFALVRQSSYKIFNFISINAVIIIFLYIVTLFTVY